MSWIDTQNRLPTPNKIVQTIIKYCDSDTVKYYKLKAVDESDCNWRFPEDNAELSYDWSVLVWFDEEV